MEEQQTMDNCQKSAGGTSGERLLPGNRLQLGNLELPEPKIGLSCQKTRSEGRTLSGERFCQVVESRQRVELEGLLTGTAQQVEQQMEALAGICAAGTVVAEHPLLNRLGLGQMQVESLEFPQGREEAQPYKLVLLG